MRISPVAFVSPVVVKATSTTFHAAGVATSVRYHTDDRDLTRLHLADFLKFSDGYLRSPGTPTNHLCR